MKQRILGLVLLVLTLSGCANAGKVACLMVKGEDSNCLSEGDTIQDAIVADRRGAHAEALRIYTAHAERGNPVAMQTLGLKYYKGEGVPQDYCTAMDWFVKAVDRNADALNALGVMHRDGKCAPVNRKIAYDVFLTVHMRGLGGEATQMRANQNLRREVAELPKADVQEALCYTERYLLKYIIEKGRLGGAPAEVLPSDKNLRIKEMSWWSEGERKGMDFTCPAPWGG